MKLTGLHFLLTYRCIFECDHCFVFSGPNQPGVFTLAQIRDLLQQARAMGTVNWIYFEGGEPFLYYPLMVKGVEEAYRMGFQVGIVSNAFWATNEQDALTWLQPLAGKLQKLTLSSDLYHADKWLSQQALCGERAAEKLGISTGRISVAQPEGCVDQTSPEPEGISTLMYRGRAARKLASQAPHYSWERYTECPYEDLVDPGRVHVDPYGNLHICQGIIIGNAFERSLAEICESYQPHEHAICGPLISGGPAELARRYNTEPMVDYADACHLCFETRRALRAQLPAILAPAQVYGE